MSSRVLAPIRSDFGAGAVYRPQPMGVLLVEDSPADARLLMESLRDVTAEGDVVLRIVRTLTEAENELRRYTFSVVLVDLGLPDGRGLANVEALRSIDRSVAIVVFTGLDDEHGAVEAIRLGAQDYVVKGDFEGEALMRLLRRAIQRNKHVRELEERQHREFYRASHDSLTGLANRELFDDRARQLLAQVQRTRETFAICYLDLDGFKAVNDLNGHKVGDQLLIRVGEILKESVRQSDTVARLGGDEFAILLWPLDETAEPGQIARRLRERVMAIRQIGEAPVTLGVSVGIAMFPLHGDSLEELMEKSDRAMYTAKRAGGGVAFHDEGPIQLPERAAELRVELSEALQNNRFSLLFHPWVDTLNGQFAGVETLLRWNREGRTQRPDEFLSGVEMAGQVSEIALHVVLKACRQWRQWRDQGITVGRMGINISSAELRDESVLQSLPSVVAAAGVQTHDIQLEVPAEVLAGEHGAQVIAQLKRFRDQGFRVVLENFGPDGESLKWLTATPLDGIKLGRHVLRALTEEGLNGPMRRFIAAVLGAAGGMGMPVIATGVETVDDRVSLQMMGCAMMQGQLFCAIETAADLPARLRAGPQGLVALS